MMERPIPETGEVLKPKAFGSVVFGHAARDLDRDQLATYFLARSSGMVTGETPLAFTAKRPEISGPTLVIEGVPPNADQLHRTGSAYIGNGPDDSPAAAGFFAGHEAEIRAANPERIGKIRSFVDWLSGTETKGHAPTPAGFRTEDLHSLTPVLEGIKLTSHSPEEAVHRSHAVINSLIDADGRPLRETYKTELDALKEKRDRDFAALEKRASDPNFLKTSTVGAGLKLAFFDVRGLDTQSGGISVAERKTGADVIFLVDETKNDNGQTVGEQFLLKIPKNKRELASHLDLKAVLANRLNASESLFGKGYAIASESGFDGHPGIIGSSKADGSALDPDTVYHSLERFFDSPRYSEIGFRDKALQVMQKAELDTFIPQSETVADNPSSIPTRKITMTVPDSNGNRIPVTITEEDLPLYESVLSGLSSASEKHALLLRKTATTEPNVITQLRDVIALEDVSRAVAGNNALRVLDALDRMSPEGISAYTPEEALPILTMISNDPVAVKRVWDANDPSYGIASPIIPDWVRSDPDAYKAGRYRYDSLPNRIDARLVPELIGTIRNSSPETQSQLADTLTRILTGREYRECHGGEVHDTLLSSTLKLIADPSFDPGVRRRTAELLAVGYGDMHNHWNAQSVKDDLLRAAASFPDAFAGILAKTDAAPKTIEGVPDSSVSTPDADAVARHIARQRESGMGSPPYTSVFVEIGRPVRELIMKEGVLRTETDGNGVPVHETVDAESFDAAVRVGKLLRTDRDHPDVPRVAQAVADLTARLGTLSPDAKIRIIRGGFPNILSSAITAKFYEDERTRPLLDRIVYCDFNLQDGKFYDSPLRPNKIYG